MKVCVYVMQYDTGLAPNPFHGVCTLAVCTPNHQRANLGEGDYIIGVAGDRLRQKLGSSNQNFLIFAMKIDNRIELNKYYNLPEYRLKIPRRNGTKVEMCGDNFYKLSNNNSLVHTGESTEHNWESVIAQDTNGNRVFYGRKFFYFGSNAQVFPNDEWARKLQDQVAFKPRGISYVLGGKARYSWSVEDLSAFEGFFKQSLSTIQIPDPVDFDRWVPDQLEESSRCKQGC